MPSAEPQKKAIVVSHTHWDRAWYLTFQQFRHRMVRMIDRLIVMLDSNPDYHSFTLDGQTILLEDYLEIRPEKKQDLKRLISSGKIIVGPWYILPDLFLVSGESVIRNLQIGLQTSREYGSAMQVGYVPDPFGHFAQLPQVLRGFGIDTFIFMRGLGSEEKLAAGTLFNWQSPDGSTVLATYLVDGYFNGAALGYPEQFGRFDGLLAEPELAVKRAAEAIEKLRDLQQEQVYLINNGFDHMPEQPDLPRLLAHVNAACATNSHLYKGISSNERSNLVSGADGNASAFPESDAVATATPSGSESVLNETQFIHGTFQQFFDAVKDAGYEHHTLSGDLLGNADHPILSSVFSTRIYLKQQNHKAQSLLERYAEPMIAIAGTLGRSMPTGAFTDYAWKLLLQNHPHDDICGCSTDGVHEDDEVRFRQVTELAESLMTEQLEALMHTGLMPPARTGIQGADVFVYNPHPWVHTAAVTTSILFANPKAEQGDRTPLRSLRAVDAAGNEVPVFVLSSLEHSIRNNFLETSWGRRYDIRLQIELPAIGYQIVHVFETGEPFATSEGYLNGVSEAAQANQQDSGESYYQTQSSAGGSVADATGIPASTQSTQSTEPTRAAIDSLLNSEPDLPFILKAASTELRVQNKRYSVHFSDSSLRFRDFLTFEFQQDNGDTYTFGPVPEADVLWSDSGSATPDPSQPDAILVHHEMHVPAGLNAEHQVCLKLTTQITLLPDGSLGFHTKYTNSARNGRLRVVLPTGMQTDEVLADAHFRLARRVKVQANTPESAPERYKAYPGELEYPTQHMNDFILAEAEIHTSWVASRGLHEFELIDRDQTTHVALTLNRSVGHLSTANGRIRRVQAGPAIEVPGAQCLREITADFAWGLVGRNERGKAMRRARTFAHPVWVREMPWLPHLKSAGVIPRRFEGLKISHPDAHVSSFRIKEDGKTAVLRLYNTSDGAISTSISTGLPFVAMVRTDLHEQWPADETSVTPCGSSFSLGMRPGEIATVLLRIETS
jgi:hypothetical protein